MCTLSMFPVCVDVDTAPLDARSAAWVPCLDAWFLIECLTALLPMMTDIVCLNALASYHGHIMSAPPSLPG